MPETNTPPPTEAVKPTQEQPSTEQQKQIGLKARALAVKNSIVRTFQKKGVHDAMRSLGKPLGVSLPESPTMKTPPSPEGLIVENAKQQTPSLAETSTNDVSVAAEAITRESAPPVPTETPPATSELVATTAPPLAPETPAIPQQEAQMPAVEVTSTPQDVQGRNLTPEESAVLRSDPNVIDSTVAPQATPPQLEQAPANATTTDVVVRQPIELPSAKPVSDETKSTPTAENTTTSESTAPAEPTAQELYEQHQKNEALLAQRTKAVDDFIADKIAKRSPDIPDEQFNEALQQELIAKFLTPDGLDPADAEARKANVQKIIDAGQANKIEQQEMTDVIKELAIQPDIAAALEDTAQEMTPANQDEQHVRSRMKELWNKIKLDKNPVTRGRMLSVLKILGILLAAMVVAVVAAPVVTGATMSQVKSNG